MADAKLYTNTPDIYKRYVKHTTQKQVLVEKIEQALLERFDFGLQKEFTFVDVGAGEGLVTIPIIQFLESKTNVLTSIIEPSPMIENFNSYRFNHLTLIQKPIEEVSIPQADFILCSHVVPYLNDSQNVVASMVSALKSGGMGLIVVTNNESDDAWLKKTLVDLSDAGMSTDIIIEYFKNLEIQYRIETVESSINVRACFDQGDDGQAIFLFMFKKPMSSLSPEELERFLKAMKGRANRNGELTKREDYIWFYH